MLAILVQPIGLPEVYLLDHGTLYYVSPQSFYFCGFNSDVIVFVQPQDLQKFKRGMAI